MNSKLMQERPMFKRFILVASVVSILALSAPMTASAVDDGPLGQQATCVYDGKEYSDGAVIQGPNGRLYKCNNGKWEWTTTKPGSSKPIRVKPVMPDRIRNAPLR